MKLSRLIFLGLLTVFLLVFTMGKLWAYFTGQPALEVLGQANLNSSTAGVGLAGFTNPANVGGDTNNLYVSDNTNNRVMVYHFPAAGRGINARWILGQSSPASIAINQG